MDCAAPEREVVDTLLIRLQRWIVSLQDGHSRAVRPAIKKNRFISMRYDKKTFPQESAAQLR
jgi:hypothetical protein